MKFICVLIVKRMMEVGKAVLQKNNFSDLNDVRYVINTIHLLSVFLTFQNVTLVMVAEPVL